MYIALVSAPSTETVPGSTVLRLGEVPPNCDVIASTYYQDEKHDNVCNRGHKSDRRQLGA